MSKTLIAIAANSPSFVRTQMADSLSFFEKVEVEAVLGHMLVNVPNCDRSIPIFYGIINIKE